VKKCLEVGADVGINYKSEDFVERTKSATGGKGAISVNYVFICV
jgi:NADPH:quinone reductase-like Zn-dependent oxidoreductase